MTTDCVGDIITVNGRKHTIIKSFVVTHYLPETDEQRKNRIKLGKPEASYSYTVLRTEPITKRITQGDARHGTPRPPVLPIR